MAKLDSPYKAFFEINADEYQRIISCIDESPMAMQVFLFLADNADSSNTVLCPSTVIQKSLEVSRMTVYRAIKLLKDRQFITVHKLGSNNVYTINPNILRVYE